MRNVYYMFSAFQCLESKRLSSRSFFFRLFNLHILQLAITLEDMEDRVRKHLEYVGLSTMSSLSISVAKLFVLQDFSIANAGGIYQKLRITSIFHLNSSTENPIGR